MQVPELLPSAWSGVPSVRVRASKFILASQTCELNT